MECIYCSAQTQVTNSRPQKKQPAIWRRRKCVGCGAVFTTSEMPDLEKSLVISQQKCLISFKRDLLFASILQACGHRKDAVEAASALTATIITHLLRQADQGVLTRKQLVTAAHTVLGNFDTAAAVQYNAYHPAD